MAEGALGWMQASKPDDLVGARARRKRAARLVGREAKSAGSKSLPAGFATWHQRANAEFRSVFISSLVSVFASVPPILIGEMNEV